MAIRPNKYSDPALGAAFENIAGMFAPPSASDTAAYATAQAKREEAERMAFLFNNPEDPHFDRRNIAVGNYAPVQGFQALEMNDATARRGQDIDAQTSLATNAADNQRGLITNMFGPLNAGQIRPELPESIAGMYGLPALPQEAGLPPMMSETEWQAGQNQRLLDGGQLTDDMLLDAIAGERAPVQAVGPEGAPMFMSPGAAVRQGAEPFVNRGAEAKPANGMAVLPNGNQIPAIQDNQTGRWRHAQTGEELPADIRVYNMGTPTGSNEDIGIRPSTQGMAEERVLSIDSTIATAEQLRDLIASAPSTQGIIGMLRGTTQDVMQTGTELGQFFGGQLAEVADSVNNGLLEAGLAQPGGLFDPTIPAQQMLTNLLAWQYAKSMSGDRVSNEQLQRAREAIGGDGLFANAANSQARLNILIDTLTNERGRLAPYAPGLNGQQGVAAQPGGGVGGAVPPTAPTAPTAPVPPGTEVAPAGIDPGVWQYLTPEERALWR